MRRLIQDQDLPDNFHQTLRDEIQYIIEYLSKYSPMMIANISSIVFLHGIYEGHATEEERDLTLQLFDEARHKTFESWDKKASND